MCGIVGLLGRVRSSEHDRFLKEAAFADTLRGSHATGALHVYYNTKSKENLWADVYKEAVSGPEFIESANGGKILTSHTNSVAVVVHNRYATGGGNQNKHAHPFQRGNVSLVHNGVIDNWREMCSDIGIKPGAKDITVDSDGMAAILEEVNDAKAVLEATEGAYALVWFDYRTNALHFARNQERPMYFAQAGQVSAFGSEAGLLQWVAGRNRIKVESVSELKVGEILTVVYDADKDQMVVGNRTSFKARARAPRVWSYASYYDDDTTSRVEWSGGNRSSQGAGTGSTYSSTAKRETKDGKSFTDLMKFIEGKLAMLGITSHTPTEWNVDRVVTDSEKDVLHCTSIENTKIKGRKVRYHTKNENHMSDWQRIEFEMFKALTSPDVDVLGALAPAGNAVLSGRASGEGWLNMTAEEIFESGSFYVYLDCAKTVLQGVSSEGTIVDCFNGPARWAEMSNRTQLRTDRVYYIEGLEANVMKNTYGGSNLVRFNRYSADSKMVVITPVNNPGVSLLIEATALKEVQQ